MKKEEGQNYFDSVLSPFKMSGNHPEGPLFNCKYLTTFTSKAKSAKSVKILSSKLLVICVPGAAGSPLGPWQLHRSEHFHGLPPAGPLWLCWAPVCRGEGAGARYRSKVRNRTKKEKNICKNVNKKSIWWQKNTLDKTWWMRNKRSEMPAWSALAGPPVLLQR